MVLAAVTFDDLLFSKSARRKFENAYPVVKNPPAITSIPNSGASPSTPRVSCSINATSRLDSLLQPQFTLTIPPSQQRPHKQAHGHPLPAPSPSTKTTSAMPPLGLSSARPIILADEDDEDDEDDLFGGDDLDDLPPATLAQLEKSALLSTQQQRGGVNGNGVRAKEEDEDDEYGLEDEAVVDLNQREASEQVARGLPVRTGSSQQQVQQRPPQRQQQQQHQHQRPQQRQQQQQHKQQDDMSAREQWRAQRYAAPSKLPVETTPHKQDVPGRETNGMPAASGQEGTALEDISALRARIASVRYLPPNKRHTSPTNRSHSSRKRTHSSHARAKKRARQQQARSPLCARTTTARPRTMSARWQNCDSGRARRTRGTRASWKLFGKNTGASRRIIASCSMIFSRRQSAQGRSTIASRVRIAVQRARGQLRARARCLRPRRTG